MKVDSVRGRFRRLVFWLLQGLVRLYFRLEAQSVLERCYSIGTGVRLRMPLVIYHPECISFGSRVDVGENTVIRGGGGISIGDDVLIAAGTSLAS